VKEAMLGIQMELQIRREEAMNSVAGSFGNERNGFADAFP
jgi:hypothetical protein